MSLKVAENHYKELNPNDETCRIFYISHTLDRRRKDSVLIWISFRGSLFCYTLAYDTQKIVDQKIRIIARCNKRHAKPSCKTSLVLYFSRTEFTIEEMLLCSNWTVAGAEKIGKTSIDRPREPHKHLQDNRGQTEIQTSGKLVCCNYEFSGFCKVVYRALCLHLQDKHSNSPTVMAIELLNIDLLDCLLQSQIMSSKLANR